MKLSGSPFSIRAYHFCGAVNLTSKGRDEFFFLISFHYSISIQQQTQLAGGWANKCISEKVFQTVKGRNLIQWYHCWLPAKKIHLLLTKLA